jgi:hypothetical protein
MTFPTDRPFYPYSEPSDRQRPSAASPDGRALRITILGDRRMTGRLADQSSWPGQLEFAGALSDPVSAKQRTVTQWLNLAGLDAAANRVNMPTTITTMLDQSNPRSGTADLFFSADADQTPYQGSAVNLDLARQNKLVITHPFLDAFAMLMVFLLPAAPLYCGWKILHFVPTKKIHRFSAPVWVLPPRPVRMIMGALAIGFGAYFGIQFELMLVGQIVSSVFGWSPLNLHWFLVEGGLLVASFPVLAMSCGLFYCGINVWCTDANDLLSRKFRFFILDGAEWQGFMAALSLLAGAVFLLAILEVFYPVVMS